MIINENVYRITVRLLPFGLDVLWQNNEQKKNNHLHERDLRIFYKDYTSSFEDLFKDKSVTIHHRNIQSLAIELFKVKQNLSNSMFNVIYFRPRSISYNLRPQTNFIKSNASTSQYGLNSMRCFASKVWQMFPLEIKNSVSIESLKEKIRKQEPSSCNCKLC